MATNYDASLRAFFVEFARLCDWFDDKRSVRHLVIEKSPRSCIKKNDFLASISCLPLFVLATNEVIRIFFNPKKILNVLRMEPIATNSEFDQEQFLVQLACHEYGHVHSSRLGSPIKRLSNEAIADLDRQLRAINYGQVEKFLEEYFANFVVFEKISSEPPKETLYVNLLTLGDIARLLQKNSVNEGRIKERDAITQLYLMFITLTSAFYIFGKWDELTRKLPIVKISSLIRFSERVSKMAYSLAKDLNIGDDQEREQEMRKLSLLVDDFVASELNLE